MQMQDPTLLIIIFVVCFIGLFVVLSLIVILPILGVFGGLGYIFADRSKKAKMIQEAAQSWPATRGTILKSRVQVSGGEYTTVSAIIEYSYQVGANEYTSRQIKPGDQLVTMFNETECYDLVEQFPVGAEVDVFYNPKKPSEAALLR